MTELIPENKKLVLNLFIPFAKHLYKLIYTQKFKT